MVEVMVHQNGEIGVVFFLFYFLEKPLNHVLQDLAIYRTFAMRGKDTAFGREPLTHKEFFIKGLKYGVFFKVETGKAILFGIPNKTHRDLGSPRILGTVYTSTPERVERRK